MLAAKPTNDPFSGVVPDFSVFGADFTSWWQKLLAGLWGLSIVIAAGGLLMAALKYRSQKSNGYAQGTLESADDLEALGRVQRHHPRRRRDLRRPCGRVRLRDKVDSDMSYRHGSATMVQPPPAYPAPPPTAPAPGRSGRRRWIAVVVVVVLVAAAGVGGYLLGRNHAGSSTAGDVSSGAPYGPARLTDGVPGGYTHDRGGAANAAVNAVQASLLVQANKLKAKTSSRSSPHPASTRPAKPDWRR